MILNVSNQSPSPKSKRKSGIKTQATQATQAEGPREIDNPVVGSCQYAYKATNIVQINDQGVKRAAKYIRQKMLQESYTPRTWRSHPLHICPDDNIDPYDAEASSGPSSSSVLDKVSSNRNKLVLDWIFLISSLNFSFWSEEGADDRFGIDWFEGWDALEEFRNGVDGEEGDEMIVHTGYWSLVAALDRALDEGIPICDPLFYSSPDLCPDNLIEHIFRTSQLSVECIPLLKERIEIMRENGRILCENFGGSFQNLLIHFKQIHQGQGSALQLVQLVTETFPKFRDEFTLDGKPIYIWKRAQILVAEIWAAFYPLSSSSPHPVFPCPEGPRIHQLTMFADYRVPQILHHLRILTYPDYLVDILTNGVPVPSGSKEELSLRAASVVSVERVREEIERLIEDENGQNGAKGGQISSVLIDFYLWDLAKEIEEGKKQVEGIETEGIVPAHRTRSIWY